MAKRRPVKPPKPKDEALLIAALRKIGEEGCPEEEFKDAIRVAMTSGSRILARGLRETFRVMANTANNVQRVRGKDDA